jgi:choice-of-anchor C domain-containing protein
MLALGASLVLSATALAGSFDNGSFEDGPNPGSHMELAVGSNHIAPWVIEAKVDYIGSYWNAAAGSRSIDMMASPSKGKISQTFETTANATYVVTFKLANNPINAAGQGCDRNVQSSLAYSAPGASGTVFTTAGSSVPSAMVYEDKGFSFVATGSESKVTFEATSSGYCGPALDMVVVTQVVPTGVDCKKDGWKSMTDNTGASFKNQGDCVSYYATGERNLANPKDDM